MLFFLQGLLLIKRDIPQAKYDFFPFSSNYKKGPAQTCEIDFYSKYKFLFFRFLFQAYTREE